MKILPNNILATFLRLPITLRILAMSIIIIVAFGAAITWIEPQNFPTFFDGVWWAIITTSTIGYGDYVPSTILGRLAGIALIFTGVGFISTYFVTLATAAVTKQNTFIEGKAMYKGKNHLIIIGWNERSRSLIYSQIQDNKKPSITLIDASLTRNPLPDSVHFIQGNPNIDGTLLMANIVLAEKVIITADQNKDELQADMSSILTLLAVKGLNPVVTCIVEILTVEQVANAERAGADEIIQSNNLTSFVMNSSLNSKDTMVAFLDLLNQLKEKKLKIIPLIEEKTWQPNSNFAALSAHTLQEGKLLIGIKRGEKTYFDPSSSFLIEEGDELIFITS
ncbi:potassium channel family protein [Niallia nealsonii]|uniref:potassium channel family protein n=1 Tax=Niallia nealsonii TaxID=115979 RepID=UPI0038B2D89F